MNTETNSKRFYIKTLGCKVNQYESQVMREILTREGFKECLAEDIADIYIINTCTVTHRADSESRHVIGLFHKLNPKAEIAVTGCYVENDSQGISFLPGVKYIIKNDDKHNIAAILKSYAAGEPASAVKRRLNLCHTISDFKGHTKAFVKIQDGCDNLCAYCKIPLVRGSSRSKLLSYILSEVRALVSKGFKEIVLTGICLGAWGRDLSENADLIDVLKALETVDAPFRVRLSSIEPRYVTDELIGYIASHPNICRHLHIPLQSGDDGTLKEMNRPYTGAGYRALISRIRGAIPGIAITTDVMVGFPGETDERFLNSLSLLKEILPSRTHIFSFSKRGGTKAAGYAGEVDPRQIKVRYERMRILSLEASFIYKKAYMGKTLDVLAETVRDRASGMLEGYSDNYIKVMFEGPDSFKGNIVPVRLDWITLNASIGTAVGN